MEKPIKKINISYTNAIIVLCILVGIYFMFNIVQGEHDKLKQNFKTIDSLKYEIHKIDSLHKEKDSVITIYKDSIVYLDRVIENDKIKIVKIKERYDKIRPTVVKYTNTQLDSFFANRYGY
jgi:hypothetical protein